MIKGVYIAPYMDSTGYAVASIENILSLDSIGVTVVPRPVKMTNTYGPVPQRILELEDNDLNNVDFVINHNLPTEFAWKSGVINIGAFAYETNSIPASFHSNLELMDQIMVFCEHQRNAILKSCGEKVYNKSYSVPHPVDTDFNPNDYETLDFGLPKSTYKFYSILEQSRRKNLPALLASYYSEFSREDDVALILKVHTPSRNPQEGSGMVKAMIEEIKNGVHRFSNTERYPKIVLITDFLTDKEIRSIHKSCDCFVGTSHGEAFSYPIMDALAWGNEAIAPNYSAFKEYLKDQGTLIEGIETKVLGCNSTPFGLYSSDEKWFNVNISGFGNAMRSHYEDKFVYNELFRSTRKRYIENKFSRKVVGQRILNNITKYAK